MALHNSQQPTRLARVMEPVNGQQRVAKRSSNACSRCRRQKIKCSGSQPCESCSKRKLSCVFNERDQKVLVTRGYIIDLQQKIDFFERGEGADSSSPGSDDAGQGAGRAVDDTVLDAGSPRDHASVLAPPPGTPGANDQNPHFGTQLGSVASALTNPLSTGPSTFMAEENGRTFYLGTSSSWSFTRRVLSMTHEHIYNANLPTGTLLFDGTAYDLGWDGCRTTLDPDPPALPTLDYAIYLINAVKFHCGQVFHLFEEEDFMRCLYDFYSDPTQGTATAGLWYIHFLLILAFGKAFVLQKNQGKKPPGADFFVKALQLLPDVTVLCREPTVSAEILCCISLYLQSLDFRNSAHNFIGQAMRMALAQGMHTDMPVQHLGERFVQRCRKIWWTVYILDREMTSLMGLPQTIHDDDVHSNLPIFSGSVQRTTALRMQIKLSRVIAETNRTVYGIDGRLNRKFLLSTKAVLASIAGLADELQQSLPLHLDKAISGISRMSAYSHLLYHQCIVLATRPLLFCFLKIRFESQDTCLDSLNSSQSVRNLIQMCIDSSQQMINILHCLQAQGLLETFLPFDLESIFISTVILLVAPAIDPSLLQDHSSWLHKAYVIFEEMISCGNLVAEFQRSELQRLDEMLSCLATDPSRCLSGATAFQQSGVIHQPRSNMPLSNPIDTLASQALSHDILPHSDTVISDECGFVTGLTTARITAVVNSIESGDTEWMSHAMAEHSIW